MLAPFLKKKSLVFHCIISCKLEHCKSYICIYTKGNSVLPFFNTNKFILEKQDMHPPSCTPHKMTNFMWGLRFYVLAIHLCCSTCGFCYQGNQLINCFRRMSRPYEMIETPHLNFCLGLTRRLNKKNKGISILIVLNYVGCRSVSPTTHEHWVIYLMLKLWPIPTYTVTLDSNSAFKS